MSRSHIARDLAGRKMPPKKLRSERASNAALHRWKDKWRLVPGESKPWSERSFADKLRHLEAVRKGGANTGGRIKEQQRLFWNWYHGNSKEGLQEPFKTVVETFEKLHAAYEQKYGANGGSKVLVWDGFFAEFFQTYVLGASWKKQPDELERELWTLFDKFMAANHDELYGRAGSPGLLQTLFDFEDAQDEKQARLAEWRSARSGVMSKNKKPNLKR